MRLPHYQIVTVTDDYVAIRDVGPWDKVPTVTNGAEEVVKQMVGYLRGRRLFYYDSEGELDEILVKDGRFNGFAPGPSSLEEVKAL